MTKFFYSNHVNGDESSYVLADGVHFHDSGAAIFWDGLRPAEDMRNIVLALSPNAWKSIWKEDGA